MPKTTGNDFWWSEVDAMQRKLGPGTHWKVAETTLFFELYKKQYEGGVPRQKIRDNFAEIYGIKGSAFDRRLNRAGFLGTLYHKTGGLY